MSEANAPSNRPSRPEDAHFQLNQQPEQQHVPPSSLPTGGRGDQVAETVTAKSLSPDALRDELGAAAETWLQSSEPTDLADLISLIQELNQCNSILLDRVSQLEKALERSQSALKAEVKRSQDHSADYLQGDRVFAQDLTAAQLQTIDLYSQLESIHQTSQRQQILIETLTGQLESSQERVAQLEREAALVQQRYNDHSQRLVQYENTCRDLQARLHRQQRYTLQFKVALEKSLDVATAPYDSVAEAVAASNLSESSVPKVQHIRPWSSQDDITPARFPWMNLSSRSLTNEMANADADADAGMEFDPSDLPIVRPKRARLAAVQLPGFQPIGTSPAADSPQQPAAVPPKLAKKVSIPHSAQESPVEAIPDAQLLQKLDSVVQPLADLIADTLIDPRSAETSQRLDHQAEAEPQPVPPNLVSFTRSVAGEPSGQTDLSPNQTTDADALLNSVMADAEDALWQDLARLIDVSTEDVVKASLSGDFSAFESINFEALQGAEASSTAEQPAPPKTGPQWFEPSAAKAKEPSASESNRDANAAIADTDAATFDSDSCWPSPVVYPLRPAKKRRSLAAVDLPSFLQPAPGPLPT